MSPNVPSPRARARGKPKDVRKQRAVGMIASGKKQGEIAKQLGVGVRQVKRYRADPEVQAMVEERRQRMLAAEDVHGREVIGVLATHMRGSLLDLLTPAGKFSVAHARSTGFDGLLKSVTIREEQGRTKKGKRTERVLITRVETHSSQTAAVELAKVLGLEKQPSPNPNDTELLRKLLDERVFFAIEGFRRGGVTLTRRDVLELFIQMPESLGQLLPLVQAELSRSE